MAPELSGGLAVWRPVAERGEDVIEVGIPFLIAKAKAAGVYKGRPAAIDPEEVRRLHRGGLGASEIAKRLGIGRASVYRLLGADKAA